jgi:hypothetical protein
MLPGEDFTPMGQPVGPAAVMAIGLGLSQGLAGVLANILKLDGKYGLVLLSIAAKLNFVEGLIGRDTANLLAMTSLIGAINGLVAGTAGKSLTALVASPILAIGAVPVTTRGWLWDTTKMVEAQGPQMAAVPQISKYESPLGRISDVTPQYSELGDSIPDGNSVGMTSLEAKLASIPA